MSDPAESDPVASGPVASGLLAIDVGSSRVKLGWFPPAGECESEPARTLFPIAVAQLPHPEETLAVTHRNNPNLQAEITDWLEQHGATESRRFVASVHPTATASVQEILSDQLRVLTTGELPIEVRVDQPERVGIDRLLNAMAVNRLRLPERAAVVVDLGTACTVDSIASDGAFEGGAILPGITLSAAALHTGTAALPQLTAESFANTPAVVGKSTRAAISSGLFWGMVGAVRELLARMSSECAPSPQLFITGGGAPQLLEHLTGEHGSIRHIPHLVLSGIALAAEEMT